MLHEERAGSKFGGAGRGGARKAALEMRRRRKQVNKERHESLTLGQPRMSLGLRRGYVCVPVPDGMCQCDLQVGQTQEKLGVKAKQHHHGRGQEKSRAGL